MKAFMEGKMRARSVIVCFVALAAALSAGCLKKTMHANEERWAARSEKAYGPMSDYGARSDHQDLDIVYAPGEPDSKYLTLDVCWNDHEGLAPMVINIHGGAWEIGDKSNVNSLFRSKYLANHGYVVFNVNYRMLPRYPIQTQVEDVMGAVIWAKEHAAKYGADPKRVGVIGGSAGGHLTAMVAWASDDDFFKPTGAAGSSFDSDVLVAVPFYGVFDLEETLAKFPTDHQTGLKAAAYRYFTDTKKGPGRDELFRHISPRYHVRPGLPPTFFVCGDADNFHLYAQSVEYEKILEQAGVPTGLFTAHGAQHGFDKNYGEDYSTGAIQATAAWLDRFLK